jgi:replicative DNA helicase
MDLNVPPHDVTLEEGLLGCLIGDPKDALSGFISQHPRCRDYFYDIRNKDIFSVILKLQDERTNIDTLTVQTALKLDNKLKSVGGLPRLAGLQDNIPSTANWPYYADGIRDYWIKRELIGMGNAAIRAGQTSPNATKALDDVQRDVLAIAQDNSGGDRSNVDMANEYMNKMAAAIKDPNSLRGLLTGYVDIDSVLNGLQPSSVIVLAARPSMGKTSLALCMAQNIAVGRNIPVGIFSLEMSAESLIARLIHMQAKVPRQEFSLNMGKLSAAASDICNAPVHIDDRSALTVQQIAAAARRMKQQHGIKCLFVDYLQLIRSTRDKGTRNDEVAEISNGLKAIAKELKVPIVVLSQLSRQVDKDSRPPKLSDLRDSGAVEQDADQVVFIWKDPNVNSLGPGMPVIVSVDKNREGESGVKIPLVFFKTYTRFENGNNYGN